MYCPNCEKDTSHMSTSKGAMCKECKEINGDPIFKKESK